MDVRLPWPLQAVSRHRAPRRSDGTLTSRTATSESEIESETETETETETESETESETLSRPRSVYLIWRACARSARGILPAGLRPWTVDVNRRGHTSNPLALGGQ